MLSTYMFIIVVFSVNSFFCQCTVNPTMCLGLKVHFDINATTKHVFSFSMYYLYRIPFPIDFISNFVSLYLDMTLLSSTSLDLKNSIWELLLTNRWVYFINNYYWYSDLFLPSYFVHLFMYYYFYYYILLLHYYAFTLLHFVYVLAFCRTGWVLFNKTPFPLFCVRSYIPFIFFYSLPLNF